MNWIYEVKFINKKNLINCEKFWGKEDYKLKIKTILNIKCKKFFINYHIFLPIVYQYHQVLYHVVPSVFHSWYHYNDKVWFDKNKIKSKKPTIKIKENLSHFSLFKNVSTTLTRTGKNNKKKKIEVMGHTFLAFTSLMTKTMSN